VSGGVLFGAARRALLVCAAWVVAGCAAPPTIEPTNGVVAQTRPALIAFTISGRFSAKNGKEQASGQFRYSQTAARRSLSIFSPLGTPMAEINADSAGAVLALSNGTTQRADSIAELLRNVIDLPVTDAQLSMWLQGRSSATLPVVPASQERDALGHLSRFNESGWDILVSDRFAANDPNGNVVDAPRRLRWALSGDPDTEVRWIIDEWKTP
jgi:outer membrane biogenesis lipoprotein LolB